MLYPVEILGKGRGLRRACGPLHRWSFFVRLNAAGTLEVLLQGLMPLLRCVKPSPELQHLLVDLVDTILSLDLLRDVLLHITNISRILDLLEVCGIRQ